MYFCYDKKCATKLNRNAASRRSWYATFLTLAGLTASEIAIDARAAAAHLPAVDSINMVPFLFDGNATSASPRTDIPLDCTVQVSKGIRASASSAKQVFVSLNCD